MAGSADCAGGRRVDGLCRRVGCGRRLCRRWWRAAGLVGQLDEPVAVVGHNGNDEQDEPYDPDQRDERAFLGAGNREDDLDHGIGPDNT